MATLEEFRQWIKDQPQNGYELIEEGNNFRLETDFAEGVINFYEIEYLIVEMRIDQKEGEENVFFLHFELNDMPHAEELFIEMVETLVSLKSGRNKQFLLSCTSALTTSFFAEKLNETSQALSLPYHFDAVPFAELYRQAVNYDAVILAPQVGYAEKKVASILTDKVILKMPAHIFGTYNAAQALDIIQSEMSRYEKSAEERAIKKIRGDIAIHGNVLALAVRSDAKCMEINYRLYVDGKGEKDGIVRKPKLNYEDIFDVLNICMCSCKKYDVISIAVPGIINNGVVNVQALGITKVELHSRLTEKYNTKIVLTNNVNAAAIGLYATRHDYETLLLHSQAYGYVNGGQGIVINGRLHTGKHNLAGEIRFINEMMSDYREIREHPCHPDNILKIVTYDVAAGIIETDPEAVFIKSPMTPDLNEIKEELAKIIPADYLPDLYYVEEYEMSEYALMGALVMGMAEI